MGHGREKGGTQRLRQRREHEQIKGSIDGLDIFHETREDYRIDNSQFSRKGLQFHAAWAITRKDYAAVRKLGADLGQRAQKSVLPFLWKQISNAP